MPFFVYTSETLPNPEMFGKVGYTPEWFRFHGVQLPVIKKGEWAKFPDNYFNLYHKDWRDRSGTRIHISGTDTEGDKGERIAGMASVLAARWGERGVIVLDHPPTAEEKAKLEPLSEELNRDFRSRIIHNFENERQMAIARQGQRHPTPYEEECYELLNVTKPYSAEALRAARDPGGQAADRIADAIAKALSDRVKPEPKTESEPLSAEELAKAREALVASQAKISEQKARPQAK